MNIENLKFTEVFPIKKMRGVYLLWHNGVVVYVGQSENILQRIGTHLADPQKWFDGFSYAVVPDGSLNQLEADLIVAYDPHLNHGKLPTNNKYVTRGYVKRHWGVGGWEFRKIIRNLKPVYREYYLAADMGGVK